MRILIAEDDLVSRKLLEATLRRWKYDVVVTEDGAAAPPSGVRRRRRGGRRRGRRFRRAREG